MFDNIVKKNNQRGKRMSQLISASIGLHGFALGAVLLIDQLRVGVVAEPAVTITFVDFSSLPPPPPPPPPKKKAAPKKEEPKPQEVKQPPKDMQVPNDIPQKEAPKEEASKEEADSGEDGGVEGGIEGGVGGQRPLPAPAAPTYMDVELVRKRRSEGRDPAYPSMALSRNIEGVVVAKITIGVDGRVTDIQFMQTHPAFERAVRAAVEGWRFQPHIVGGRAVSVYSIFRFTFKLK